MEDSTYNAKSCNALEKVYYRPIEVAIRWCNLVEFEKIILDKMENNILPTIEMFPKWPCLRLNTERIYDAIENNEMPHGRDGKAIQPNDHVAVPRRTVRHADLKEWMQRRYPDQKPEFLFDVIERTTHAAINADSFLALQVERDALKARIEKATDVYKALKSEKDAVVRERDECSESNKRLSALVESAEKQLSTNERNTLLVLIAALCKQANIDYNKAGISSALAAATDEIGAPITDDTIRKILKQIPLAVESRSK